MNQIVHLLLSLVLATICTAANHSNMQETDCGVQNDDSSIVASANENVHETDSTIQLKQIPLSNTDNLGSSLSIIPPRLLQRDSTVSEDSISKLLRHYICKRNQLQENLIIN